MSLNNTVRRQMVQVIAHKVGVAIGSSPALLHKDIIWTCTLEMSSDKFCMGLNNTVKTQTVQVIAHEVGVAIGSSPALLHRDIIWTCTLCMPINVFAWA